MNLEPSPQSPNSCSPWTLRPSHAIAAVICWALAFGVGYTLRPVHPWVTPLVLVVLGVVASYIAAEMGDYDPPGGIWVFIGLVIMAGLPLTFLIWIGRETSLTRAAMKPLKH